MHLGSSLIALGKKKLQFYPLRIILNKTNLPNFVQTTQ